MARSNSGYHVSADFISPVKDLKQIILASKLLLRTLPFQSSGIEALNSVF